MSHALRMHKLLKTAMLGKGEKRRRMLKLMMKMHSLGEVPEDENRDDNEDADA